MERLNKVDVLLEDEPATHEAEDVQHDNQRYLRYGGHGRVMRLRRRSKDLVSVRVRMHEASRLQISRLLLRLRDWSGMKKSEVG